MCSVKYIRSYCRPSEFSLIEMLLDVLMHGPVVNKSQNYVCPVANIVIMHCQRIYVRYSTLPCMCNS